MTIDDILEVFARELYVHQTSSGKSRIMTRRRWYLGIKAGVRETYRGKARELIASLRTSEIELVHQTARDREVAHQ